MSRCGQRRFSLTRRLGSHEYTGDVYMGVTLKARTIKEAGEAVLSRTGRRMVSHASVWMLLEGRSGPDSPSCASDQRST